MATSDPDTQRAELLESWESAAAGWERGADQIREFGMPVSKWMIDHLAPVPGQRVLELAAGPGDTGFLVAELIRPGGTLVCSDATEGMLEIARARAARMGLENVEFVRLELEWIDLPTASVDGILCRWGIMLIVDPAAALSEARRVLRPGGRVAVAVWDLPEHNPWATVPNRAMIELGHVPPPDPDAPGMFRLAAPGRLARLLESAGFTEVAVESAALERAAPSLDAFLQETLDLARPFRAAYEALSEDQRQELSSTIARLAEPFTQSDGSIRFPGSSLVAAASA
jgi:SAM-dependent methyltransferase